MNLRRIIREIRPFHLMRRRWLWSVAVFLSLEGAEVCVGQLCGQLSGVTFSENFNSLLSTGSAQMPAGFEFAFNEAGSAATLTYSANDGTSTAGDTYSYGVTGNGDRALGELTSGTAQSTIGACFTNNTNHAITTFVVGYTGEQWRLGAAGATVDRLDFQYSTDATSITTGTYINVDELDFSTPDNVTAVAKDGNSAADRKVFAPFAITPASPIQPEATFYLRWRPVLIAEANDGLAIDDFSIGTILAPGVAGDYNNDGAVDAADYTVWRNNINQSVTIPNDITPGTVVKQDFQEWKDRYGKTKFDFGAGATIPEPAGWMLALGALGATVYAVGGRVRTY